MSKSSKKIKSNLSAVFKQVKSEANNKKRPFLVNNIFLGFLSKVTHSKPTELIQIKYLVFTSFLKFLGGKMRGFNGLRGKIRNFNV